MNPFETLFARRGALAFALAVGLGGAAFTTFGDFSPSGGTFLPLANFNGFVPHTGRSHPPLPRALTRRPSGLIEFLKQL